MNEIQTQTRTVSLMVIRPNAEPIEHQTVSGTTVGALASEIGLPDGANLPAVNVNTGETLGPETPITEDGVLSYVYKLAGA